MNLSNRSIFLISPVIFFACVVASAGAYWIQKEAILRKIRTDVESELAKINAVYSKFETFSEMFFISTTQSRVFKNLIRQEKNKRRINHTALTELLNEFTIERDHDLSLLITREDKDILFHYNSIVDPFSDLPDWEINTANSTDIESNSIEKYLLFKDRNTYLLLSKWVKSRDAGSSVDIEGKKANDRYRVFTFIELKQFNHIIKNLEEKYSSSINFYQNLEHFAERRGNNLNISMDLSEKYFMWLVVPNSLASESLSQLKVRVIFWCLLFTSIFSFSLSILIRRYITEPIAILDKNLSEVIDNPYKKIMPLQTSDELGRLSQSFSQLHSRTIHMAEFDLLTGVPNRHKISELAETVLEESDQNQIEFSILFIDLDNFKYVNDNYGHEIGDGLLIAFCHRIERLIENGFSSYPSSTLKLGRIGGDEFVLLVPNAGLDIVKNVAHSIIDLFKGGFEFNSGTFPVTVSIGIAVYPDDADKVESLMAKADASMYQAKLHGKNQYAFYSSKLAEQLNRKSEVESALIKADFDSEFYLVYMPIVNGADTKIVGAEVLLRWQSKELGLIPPDEFITIAESKGLFTKIDLWVIEHSLSDFKLLERHFGQDFVLSINISSAELSSHYIMESIVKQLERYKISSNRIILEITETFKIQLNEDVKNLLYQFSDLGIKLAIDDFGTGHTSLMQMIEYPADIIKFDKSLVENLYSNNHVELANSLVNLCHGQNFKVTAEGIENKQQFDFMLRSGCDHFQGFYFCKPLIIGDFLNLNHQKKNP